uniref:7TM_GPCR_Srx domain-containing protein n=1 Tax=Strongyloides stercoralis TaxID=6248 RepID=A0A0K0E991_STRER
MENDTVNSDVVVSKITFLSRTQVGLIYFISSGFFTVVQILVFKSLYVLKSKYKSMPFIILKHHSVVSFIQQICHLITSIKTIFDIYFSYVTFTIVGAVLSGGYISSLAFMFLLSLNRCDIMYNCKYFLFISREKFFNIAIILSYVYFFVAIAFYLYPDLRMTFRYDIYAWDYIVFTEITNIGVVIEKCNTYSLTFLSILLYLLIFCKIIYLRNYQKSSSYFSSDDIKLIIHLLIYYSLLGFLQYSWSYFSKGFFSKEFGALIQNFVFISLSGANATYTLFFIRDFNNNICCKNFCCKCYLPILNNINTGKTKPKKINMKVVF